ncbi:hypothetical protein KSS87_001261, partial [Heliosperma pusillum]
MASTNDSSDQDSMKQQQLYRKRGPNLMLLLPLIYAPVLPLSYFSSLSLVFLLTLFYLLLIDSVLCCW